MAHVWLVSGLMNFASSRARADSCEWPIDCSSEMCGRPPNQAFCLDCGTREPTLRDDFPASWQCKLASSYQGSCIPQSDFHDWACLELDAPASLCNASAPFDMTVVLTTNDVSFDGNGQTIEPTGGAPTANCGFPRPAFRAVYQYSLSNIDIANCTLLGEGIELKRIFRADDPCLRRPTSQECAASCTQYAGTAASNCESACARFSLRIEPTCTAENLLGHRDIRVREVGFVDAGIGVFVGQASRDILLSNLSVHGSASGIYVEAGSSGVKILDSSFADATRRGIAIDSSFGNDVVGCSFASNAIDLELYKNAGEKGGEVCPVRRESGANYNLVHGNWFTAPVRVASREGGPVSDFHLECGEYIDEAEGNRITNNVFGSSSSLALFARTFEIVRNQFSGDNALTIGTSRAGHSKVFDGKIVDNVFGSPGVNVLSVSGAQSGSILVLRHNIYSDGSCLPSYGNNCSSASELTIADIVNIL